MSKKKAVLNQGVFGNAIDYSIYNMNKKEKLVGFMIGMAVGFAVVQIFFLNVFVSITASLFAGFLGIRIYRMHLLSKRQEVLLIQFKDLLEALCTSFGSGKNTVDAFTDSYHDLLNQLGKDAYIVQEIVILLTGLKNNFTIEKMLGDFADRSRIEDIQNFADVFEVTNRMGGNIIRVIDETRNIIIDKVNIQLEINTLISGKKNELNIMILLPLIVVTQLQGITDSAGMIGILSKAGALILFAGAYALGQKMIKIRI